MAAILFGGDELIPYTNMAGSSPYVSRTGGWGAQAASYDKLPLAAIPTITFVYYVNV